VLRNVILRVVLYGCESRSLTSRDEHRPKVLENRVLRETFRSTEEEDAAGWLMLHGKVLRDGHSGEEIKEDKTGRACGTYEVVIYIQGFGCETRKERDHLENLGVDGS